MGEPYSYDADSIRVPEYFEAIRKRPGMFVGDVHDGSGLRQMLWEVVANCVDQHLMRRVRAMSVELRDGWICVEDDGLGIPVEVDPRVERPTIEAILTVWSHRPSWDGHDPHIHVGGLFGAGLAVVNALTERLEVETTRDGSRWATAFERGVQVEPLRSRGPANRVGTRVRFRPDPSIFTGPPLRDEDVAGRVRELAWLNPLLAVRFQGEPLPGRGGVGEWMRSEAPNARASYVALRPSGEVQVELALAWGDDGAAPSVRSFVNMLPTRDGTHVNGLWKGLAEWASNVSPNETISRGRLREALGPGLRAIVHVGMYETKWAGPTKEQLLSPAAGRAVRRVMREDAQRVLFERSPTRAFLLGRLGR